MQRRNGRKPTGSRCILPASRFVCEEWGHEGFDEDFGGRRFRRRIGQRGACVRAILSGQRLSGLWQWRERHRPGAQPGARRRLWQNGYGNNGYGGYGGGANSQMAVNQCAAAVQQRLGGGYNGYGYNGGYNNGYNNGYASGGGRVLGINRIEPRSNGGLTVRGVASSGQYAGYAYGGQGQADLTFKCKVDYRGYVSDVELRRTNNYGSNYSQNNSPTTRTAPTAIAATKRASARKSMRRGLSRLRRIFLCVRPAGLGVRVASPKQSVSRNEGAIEEDADVDKPQNSRRCSCSDGFGGSGRGPILSASESWRCGRGDHQQLPLQSVSVR